MLNHISPTDKDLLRGWDGVMAKGLFWFVMGGIFHVYHLYKNLTKAKVQEQFPSILLSPSIFFIMPTR